MTTLPPGYVPDVESMDLRPDPEAISTVKGLVNVMRWYRLWGRRPVIPGAGRGAVSG